jgi:hypothetical protein
MDTRQTGVRFTGGALWAFGYSLLFLILFLLLLPGAWGAVPLAIWWTSHLAFDDGTRAEFTGRPGQVWVLFAVMALLAYLPGLATMGLPKGEKAQLIQFILGLALFPLDAAVKLPMYRWFIENIRLTPGGTARFTGTYGPYLGWSALVAVSVVTVIGWAWAMTALTRWFCRHIEADTFTVEFSGTGLALLWRGFVWLFGMVLVLPIPWVLRSMYGWWANNLVVIQK